MAIGPCSQCKSKDTPAAQYQDEHYGAGQRVQNPVKSTSGKDYRCTVCGQVNELKSPR